ncbi:preprotein translocase subunit SecE [Desertivirga arenae]|uniref:preprotein translocase subunit SecE n=1 Tax=Desertivirga arenae TaxID=2810309 RepID=UPI001A95C880|nr:preprotein translocase subunit SecE [Pedobacter sp. SYSU D00823]
MANVIQFLKESYDEMTTKVSWPTWSELQSSAVIVLVASLIIALVVLAMDQMSGGSLKLFYQSVA